MVRYYKLLLKEIIKWEGKLLLYLKKLDKQLLPRIIWMDLKYLANLWYQFYYIFRLLILQKKDQRLSATCGDFLVEFGLTVFFI